MTKKVSSPSVQLQFTNNGYLKAVLLIASSDREHAILEKSLRRLFSPGVFGWIRRLFKTDGDCA